MAWKITFFDKKVEEETYRFPPDILADFLHIAELIEKFGRPRIIRNQGRGQGRHRNVAILFCFKKRDNNITFFYQENQKDT